MPADNAFKKIRAITVFRFLLISIQNFAIGENQIKSIDGTVVISLFFRLVVHICNLVVSSVRPLYHFLQGSRSLGG